MRTLCIILIFFTVTGMSYAADDTKAATKLIKLVYENGRLANQGDVDILKAEIISPFYRYLGDVPKGQKADVSDIRTQFTVQFIIKQWLGRNETMKETFVPIADKIEPEPSLVVETWLKGDVLAVKVTSPKKIDDVYIEILSDIPVRISEDRVRYILSGVGVIGQSLKLGPEAIFKLYLINDQPFYKVPVDISFVYAGSVRQRIFFFSFRKEDFNSGKRTP